MSPSPSQRLPNVPNSPSSYAAYARPITRIEIVDPLTIRFHTAEPYPLLPLDMTNVRIIDKEVSENATTEDFNSLRAAIGTGPYRAVAHRNGDRIEFERFDGYWGERAPFQRVNYRMITNDAARTAALLAGDVDLIDQVPTSDLTNLRRNNSVHLSETLGLRLVFLGLDHLRQANENSPLITDNDGKPLGRNPLQRRAGAPRAVDGDRPSRHRRARDGRCGGAGQPVPARGRVRLSSPTCRRRPMTRTARSALLAEAGYPNGFRIQLNGPNDRYINDSRIIQAVGQMWTRIGVRTAVEAQPWTTFVGRAGRQDFSAFLIGWGSNPDGSHPLRNILATVNRDRGWGASNRGRYSNPQVDALLLESLSELDNAKREREVVDAMRIAMTDVGRDPAAHPDQHLGGAARLRAHARAVMN